MEFDAVLLSRVQFAFTIAFHVIFPTFTIGLASYLAVLEGLWLGTKREAYKQLYLFWIKIFAIVFGLGIATKVVVLYQFGTNWSRFSELTGNVLAPLLGYEMLTIFCIQAPFLAIMLLGWQRVGKGFHFFATCMVALGALAAAFWMVSANSWMHSPAGYELIDGTFYVTRWWDVVFNPTFSLRLFHMLNASYLTTTFVVVGVAAVHIIRKTAIENAIMVLRTGLVLAAILAPIQLFSGHQLGVQVQQYQPAKFAAIAGLWETPEVTPLILFALPDQNGEKNRAELSIPALGNLFTTGDKAHKVEGLKTWAKEDQPPAAIVFWSFRIMVGIGILMALIGFYGAITAWRGKISDKRWFQRLLVAFMPAGFIAVIAGWTTAEVGRQPFLVYGLLRTEASLSPIIAEQVVTSLLAFIVTYAVIFAASILYMGQIVLKGPGPDASPSTTETGT